MSTKTLLDEASVGSVRRDAGAASIKARVLALLEVLLLFVALMALDAL
jgi:hypothetical protein